MGRCVFVWNCIWLWVDIFGILHVCMLCGEKGRLGMDRFRGVRILGLNLLFRGGTPATSVFSLLENLNLLPPPFSLKLRSHFSCPRKQDPTGPACKPISRSES